MKYKNGDLVFYNDKKKGRVIKAKISSGPYKLPFADEFYRLVNRSENDPDYKKSFEAKTKNLTSYVAPAVKKPVVTQVTPTRYIVQPPPGKGITKPKIEIDTQTGQKEISHKINFSSPLIWVIIAGGAFVGMKFLKGGRHG